MPNSGWLLVVVGVLIAVTGLAWVFLPSLPWLGKLPGDVVVERENFTLYLPLTTCIVLSVLLTGVLWAIRAFTR